MSGQSGSLALAEFAIEFIDEDTLTTCADNLLVLKDSDKDGNFRENPAPYVIPDDGVDGDAMTINLKKVNSMEGCKLERVFEYQDPWSSDYWIEIREEQGVVEFDFETAMTVTITFNQKWFIDNYYMFYQQQADSIINVMPEEVKIAVRVRTIAVNMEVEDKFTVTIVSSGETQADLCSSEFDGLQLKENTGMSGTREWIVPTKTESRETKYILITPDVDVSALSWQCAEQVY
jgi:hypothetical protein